MSEENSEEDEPKKKKPIVIIAAALGVTAIAAGGLLMKGGGSDAEAAEHGDGAGDDHGEGGDAHGGGDAHDGGGGGAPASSPIIHFKPVVVNLNEPEGGRYLKATLAVQLASDGMVDQVERLKPVIRDYIIRDLSDLNFRNTMGNKNKMAIKRRLLKRVNEAIGSDAALDVHFTEFVVQ